jgi:hypothetical protein
VLKQHNACHCVVAIGYSRNLSSLHAVTNSGVELSEAHWDRYDRLTGEVPLPAIPAVTVTKEESQATGSSASCDDACEDLKDTTPSAVQQPEKRRCSGLFGGGIAFPQDLIDGGGNREPWVGFKRSIEQVDLMVRAMSCDASTLHT